MVVGFALAAARRKRSTGFSGSCGSAVKAVTHSESGAFLLHYIWIDLSAKETIYRNVYCFWRKHVGIEPTRDAAKRPTLVLKTRGYTSTHLLPKSLHLYQYSEIRQIRQAAPAHCSSMHICPTHPPIAYLPQGQRIIISPAVPRCKKSYASENNLPE